MKFKKEDIKKAVAENYTMADTLRALGSNRFETHYRTMWKYINNLNLDTSHWTLKKSGVVLPGKTRELKDILIEDSDYKGGSNLRKRLIREGLLKEKCSECEIVEWNNKPLSFHLDHINGNSTDNRLENLRILCPNCHSQTPTFGSKNRYTCQGFNISKQNKCIDCKVPIYKRATRCRKCAIENRKYATKIKWPPSEEIRNKLKTMNYEELARELNVSSNGIRKRLKDHG